MISFLKLLKFGLVGFSGMLIDFAITYICKEWFKINKYISNMLGFTFAVINNYFLNRIWTFHSNDQNWHAEFGKFLLFSLTGLALNTLLVYFMNEKAKLNFYWAKAIAIICVFFWNYSLNALFNFKH